MADAADSKSAGFKTRAGSTPVSGILDSRPPPSSFNHPLPCLCPFPRTANRNTDRLSVVAAKGPQRRTERCERREGLVDGVCFRVASRSVAFPYHA